MGSAADDIAHGVIAKWSAAFAELDADALSSLYSKHALFYGSNPTLYRGRDGVNSYFAGLPRWKTQSVRFTDVSTEAAGIGPLVVASLGIILMGLLRTPLRWSGAGVLALAIVWAATAPRPDILISGDGRNVAVRGKDGGLHLMRSGKDAFAVKEWLAADADSRNAADASLAEGVSCDTTGCVTETARGALVALSLRPEAMAEDCERAALIVTARQIPTGCGASVIDSERLRRQGALALLRSKGGFAIEAVKPRGIDRPWSPSAGGDTTDGETTILLSRPARQAVDATPSEADLQADD